MKIKLLVMDVDGTLTDGHIYMGASGEVMKAFNCKDGYGVARILPEHGIIPVIITGRSSDIVKNRCDELGVTELHQGIIRKLPLLISIADKYGVNADEIAYIGDDLNDLDCIEYCGLTACPADGHKDIIARVDYVCKQNGGMGAVRDFIDYIV